MDFTLCSPQGEQRYLSLAFAGGASPSPTFNFACKIEITAEPCMESTNGGMESVADGMARAGEDILHDYLILCLVMKGNGVKMKSVGDG